MSINPANFSNMEGIPEGLNAPAQEGSPPCFHVQPEQRNRVMVERSIQSQQGVHVEHSEKQIILDAAQGDYSGFHALVDRYGQLLYRIATTHTSNASDCEDLVQETFDAAMNAAKAFKGKSTVKSWLISILYRRAARHHRYWRIRKTSSIEAMHEEGGLEFESTKADPAAKLDRESILASLPEEFSTVLVLREVGALSYEEIAATLNIPRGTVESRIYRARQRIREQYASVLDNSPASTIDTKVKTGEAHERM